ncbi:IS66 family transposase [Thiolapillus sp.]|uniref:IS66 family transposase n=1 Tax=Thiolapillus sp. TaxID=2017437 RepID=UPI003AF969A8
MSARQAISPINSSIPSAVWKPLSEASGVIPRYGGVIIHDCWASYLSYDQCGHGLCGSHLLRELTFVIDSNDYAWAANMKRLLQETCSRKPAPLSPNANRSA